MKLNYIIAELLAVVALTAPPAQAHPNSARSIQSYAIEPAEFSFSINGLEFNMSGTIQEVYTHLQTLGLEFVPNVTTAPSISNRASLNKVQPPLCCPVAGQSWGEADEYSIVQGIVYLNNLDTRINIGGKTCSRISCSYNSAIVLCNDNNYSIQPASKYIASYAADLDNDCMHSGNGVNPVLTVCGQEFDTDNYNVIVKSDSC